MQNSQRACASPKYALLTVKEVAQMLKAKPSTVYGWAEQGIIPSFKLNGLLRFLEDDILAWIEACRKPAEGTNVSPSPSFHFKAKRGHRNDVDSIVRKVIDSATVEGYNHLQRGNQTESGPEKGGR